MGLLIGIAIADGILIAFWVVVSIVRVVEEQAHQKETGKYLKQIADSLYQISVKDTRREDR